MLITGPDVIVADEPTTLLDLRNARMVNDLLAGLDEQVVLVTHHLHLLDGFDRVVVLDAGRVVADGPPARRAVETYTGSADDDGDRPLSAGSSVLHRIPAGWKLLGMLLAIIGVVLLTAPWQLGVAAAGGGRRVRARPDPGPGGLGAAVADALVPAVHRDLPGHLRRARNARSWSAAACC